MRLHGYWRSGTSYRARIALNLKGLRYEQATHDLRAGAQREPGYLDLAPQGLVPALETDEGRVLTQSPAILEWLEEAYPAPPLLPAAKIDRASVRAMAALVACDIHPLNNLRVLKVLRHDLDASPEQIKAWTARWIAAGFEALETMIGRHGAGFAFGDTPTLADCCIVPQLYAAERFEVDLIPYPRIREAGARMAELPEVAAAHPDRQPDADRA